MCPETTNPGEQNHIQSQQENLQNDTAVVLLLIFIYFKHIQHCFYCLLLFILSTVFMTF